MPLNLTGPCDTPTARSTRGSSSYFAASAGGGRGQPSCGASGIRTRNEEPPPGRSSTQALPPCSSAKRATRVSPMPTPGAWVEVPGPWRNGSKTLSRSSAGMPAPASSTASSTPSPPAGCCTRTHTGASGGVCRAALASRFSMIRSTLPGSRETVTGWATTWGRRPLSRPQSSAILAARAATSVGRGLGATTPVGCPLQGDEVVEQPVELAGVGHQPGVEVGPVLLGHVAGLVLQGQADADDRGQGGAQLVRHRVQEGVLHPVQGQQPLGRLLFALQGPLDGGDVDGR